MMGNALVVGLVERIADSLRAEISAAEDAVEQAAAAF
jgi:hypothetical protein